MAKVSLCCLVNPEGTCRKCREKKCSTHSFKCEQCKRVCYDCRRPEQCDICSAEICNKCSMVTRERAIACAICYDNKMYEYDMEDGLAFIDYHD